MERASLLNGRRRQRQSRAYGVILGLLVGLGALGAWAALSLDTSAQAGTKGDPQSVLGQPSTPDCGLDWSVVDSPSPPGVDINYLYAVAAVSANDVWAVGNYNSSSCCAERRTLVERWDGISWQFVYSPSPSQDQDHYLYAVDALSANDVWVVGNYSSKPLVTVVERYNPCMGTPSPVPSACPIQYTDVTPGSAFYDYVRCLACRSIVGGYNSSPPCTTGIPCFLPGNNVTRGQMAKFISKAATYQDAIPPNQQTFTDVPPNSTFWIYVERVYLHGVVTGYTNPARCPTGVPCYLPNKNVTRGQAASFISKAANYHDAIPSSQQTFTDVPPSQTFWRSIERVYMHTIVGGYRNSPPCTTGNSVLPARQPSDKGADRQVRLKSLLPGLRHSLSVQISRGQP